MPEGSISNRHLLDKERHCFLALRNTGLRFHSTLGGILNNKITTKKHENRLYKGHLLIARVLKQEGGASPYWISAGSISGDSKCCHSAHVHRWPQKHWVLAFDLQILVGKWICKYKIMNNEECLLYIESSYPLCCVKNLLSLLKALIKKTNNNQKKNLKNSP